MKQINLVYIIKAGLFIDHLARCINCTGYLAAHEMSGLGTLNWKIIIRNDRGLFHSSTRYFPAGAE